MGSTPVDSVVEGRATKRMIPRKILIILGLLAAGFVAFFLPVRTDKSLCDPVTGSHKTQTFWFGIGLRPQYSWSGLEDWIAAREGGYESRWRCSYTLDYNLFGILLVRGCSPSSTDARVLGYDGGEIGRRFVAKSTEAEIAEFIRIMRHGTDDERREAADAALRSSYDPDR